MSIALFVCKVSINIRGNEKAINKGEMRLMDEIVGGTRPQTMARRQKNSPSRRGQNISESRSEAHVNKTSITLASCQNFLTTWRYFRVSPEPRCLPLIITLRRYLRSHLCVN